MTAIIGFRVTKGVTGDRYAGCLACSWWTVARTVKTLRRRSAEHQCSAQITRRTAEVAYRGPAERLAQMGGASRD